MKGPYHRFARVLSVAILTLVIAVPALARPSLASLSTDLPRTAVECGSRADTGSQTQPLSLAATTADWDEDGLSDTTEVERTFTNPCDPDTDDDWLLDSWEVDPAEVDPAVDRAGFYLADDGTLLATRDQV